MKQIIVTLGNEGVFYSSADESGHLPPYTTDIIDVTGADDTFASCAIYGMMLKRSLIGSCQLGLAGAALTLQTEESISPVLKPEKLHEIIKTLSE